MSEKNIRYITNQEGKIDEVILPITLFEKMVEDLEDKELLRLMKRVKKKCQAKIRPTLSGEPLI